MPKGRDYKLSKKNSKAIDNYISDITLEFTNPNTLRDHKQFNIMLLGTINKDYDKITPDDISKAYSKFKPTSVEVMKSKNRRFFKFVGRNDLANKIKLNPKILRKPIYGDEITLTPEEINTLIKCNKDQQDKAIVETFIVTGGRINELCHLKLYDIEKKPNIIWITLKPSKQETKPKKIPIVAISDIPTARYPKYLLEWINNHINKDESNSPVFYSRARNHRGEQYSKSGIYKVIRRAYELSGIKKPLSPHLIRHTVATYDGQFLPETMLRAKYGWKAGSPQLERYSKADSNRLADELLNRAGIDKDESKKGQECLRCGTINHINAEYCNKCKLPLSREIIFKELEEERKKTKAIEERISELENDFKFIIPYFSDVINKTLFKLNSKHLKELNKIEEKYRIHYQKGEITKDEFIKQVKKDADDYYEENADKILLNSIEDFRNFRNVTIKERQEKIISKKYGEPHSTAQKD